MFLTLLLFMLLFIFISILIFLISYIIIKPNLDIEKISTYVCGFEPFKDARNNHLMNYALILMIHKSTLVFQAFDLLYKEKRTFWSKVELICTLIYIYYCKLLSFYILMIILTVVVPKISGTITETINNFLVFSWDFFSYKVYAEDSNQKSDYKRFKSSSLYYLWKKPMYSSFFVDYPLPPYPGYDALLFKSWLILFDQIDNNRLNYCGDLTLDQKKDLMFEYALKDITLDQKIALQKEVKLEEKKPLQEEEVKSKEEKPLQEEEVKSKEKKPLQEEEVKSKEKKPLQEEEVKSEEEKFKEEKKKRVKAWFKLIAMDDFAAINYYLYIKDSADKNNSMMEKKLLLLDDLFFREVLKRFNYLNKVNEHNRVPSNLIIYGQINKMLNNFIYTKGTTQEIASQYAMDKTLKGVSVAQKWVALWKNYESQFKNLDPCWQGGKIKIDQVYMDQVTYNLKQDLSKYMHLKPVILNKYQAVYNVRAANLFVPSLTKSPLCDYMSMDPIVNIVCLKYIGFEKVVKELNNVIYSIYKGNTNFTSLSAEYYSFEKRLESLNYIGHDINKLRHSLQKELCILNKLHDSIKNFVDKNSSKKLDENSYKKFKHFVNDAVYEAHDIKAPTLVSGERLVVEDFYKKHEHLRPSSLLKALWEPISSFAYSELAEKKEARLNLMKAAVFTLDNICKHYSILKDSFINLDNIANNKTSPLGAQTQKLIQISEQMVIEESTQKIFKNWKPNIKKIKAEPKLVEKDIDDIKHASIILKELSEDAKALNLKENLIAPKFKEKLVSNSPCFTQLQVKSLPEGISTLDEFSIHCLKPLKFKTIKEIKIEIEPEKKIEPPKKNSWLLNIFHKIKSTVSNYFF